MGKLHLLTGDIIENCKDKDAIVNPQNKYMINGSGVNGAIYRQAGIELLNYCKQNYSKEMDIGEIRITPGFNLNIDIIHILAPIYNEHNDPIIKLIECYENLLNVLKNAKYKKILMPSLGCGYHGYKHDIVASQIIPMLYEFCNNNDIDIYFINLYPIYTDFYLNELLNIKQIKLDKNILEANNILEYLYTEGLLNHNIKDLYIDFCKGKDIKQMCLSEKIICLQYTLEKFKVNKKELLPLLESLI